MSAQDVVPRPSAVHILGGRELGGISTVVFVLLEHLGKHSVPMVFALENTPLVEKARKAGFRTEVIPWSRAFPPASVLRMTSLLRRNRCTLIHTHSVLAHLYGYALKKTVRDLVFVAHVHANIREELNSQGQTLPKRFIYYHGTEAALRACDVLIVNSEAVKQDLAGRGIAPDKISVIYNGVDIERIKHEAGRSDLVPPFFAEWQGRPVVGTLGRFAPVKNQALLIRAARLVADNRPDAMFVVAGEGRERKRLEQLRMDLGLEKNLVITGWLDSPYAVLARMDIVVLPSVWEGLGVTILEAMALSKPIVATRVGGIPEVVRDGETGFLTAPGDAGAMAKAILNLLGDEDLARAMGRAGRALVEARFSCEEMAAKVRAAYEGAARGRRDALEAARISTV